MGKYILLSLMLISFNLNSQDLNNSVEKQEVHDVIIKLFDGMRAGDSSMVHSVFSDDVRMYTSAENSEGNIVIKKGDLQAFLNAVGTPHDDIWDEKIWNTKVDVEMGVAQVWTDYAFYIGDKFSHCGIDAFQLIEQNGWKIIQLIDTRKKVNCEKPK